MYTRRSVTGQFVHLAMNNEKDMGSTVNTTAAASPEILKTDFRKSAEALLLANYTPANVIVMSSSTSCISREYSSFSGAFTGQAYAESLKMAREDCI